MTKTIEEFLGLLPKLTELPSYDPNSDPSDDVNEWANIKAVTYDGATIGGRKTKVFAYMGFPSGASVSEKVPAIVLVHGGGGHAFAEWVQLWNGRGYAAIAMDNTGHFPSAAGKGLAGREFDAMQSPPLWQHGLYGDFSEAGYTNAPNNDLMGACSQDLDQQWMYHAVTQTILAHNILRADSRVDSGKIGISGISWGGIISSIAIGCDTRYAFAVPIYGCGYLDQGFSYMRPYFSQTEAKKLWSAADRFGDVKVPVLWLAWANDPPFSINSNSLSYDATKSAGAVLCLKQDWFHSHIMGYLAEESYRFADSVVRGGPALTRCVTEPSGRTISFTIQKPEDAAGVAATAYYLTQKLSYSPKEPGAEPTIDQTWQSAACAVDGNTVTGTLPADALQYYVELTSQTPDGEYITTTRFVEI